MRVCQNVAKGERKGLLNKVGYFYSIAFNIGKMCRKTNLKELKAVMEVLFVYFILK